MVERFTPWLVGALLSATPACSGSEDTGSGSATGGSSSATGGSAAATGGSSSSSGGSGGGQGGAGNGDGLCAVVDVDAVEALMEEPLEVSVDTELLCRLAGTDSSSFVVERVLTGGADHYDQQADLLGVDEELSGLGDRAFRSGYIYGVQLGEQYVAVTFAILKVLDADARLEIVTDIVEAL